MELKKIAVAVIVLAGAVVVISLVRAAGPTTVPLATPAATPATRASAPATKPAGKPLAVTSDNSNANRRDRNTRRGSGRNRDGSSAMTVSLNSSDPYAVLDTRSIFIKGNQTLAGGFAPRSAGENAGDNRIWPNRQASALIFNGVILVNDEALAMVEDTNTGTVVKVHAGDLISGGRVTGITFNDLAYEANGQTKHVEIGQNLEGRAASNGGYSNSAVAAPTSMPSGGPPPAGVTSPPGSSTAGMSPDDILAKLKARRAAESGGK